MERVVGCPLRVAQPGRTKPAAPRPAEATNCRRPSNGALSQAVALTIVAPLLAFGLRLAEEEPHCYCQVGSRVRNLPTVLRDNVSLASLARRIRVEAHAAWLCARDPRTPWYARAFGLLITAYALSPIDLIPDFIPILGLLDDAILIPAGIWLFVKMVPPHVFEEHRALAAAAAERPGSIGGAAIVVALWILAALLVGRLFGLV